MDVKRILDRMKRELISCCPTHTIRAVANLLAANNVGALPVCDDEGRLVGIISERDIVRSVAERDESIFFTPVSEIMNTNVTVCKPSDPLTVALQLMFKGRFRHLPVVDDDNKVLGFISQRYAMECRLLTRKWTAKTSQAKS